VEGQLRPFVSYLRSLGADATAAASVITHAPHLLGFSAETLFAPRVECLSQRLGLTPEQLAAMLGRSTRFLTVAGGVGEQVDALLGASGGLSREQAAALVVAAPDVLAGRAVDLERKLRFLRDDVGATTEELLAEPWAVALPLMQHIGPRHSFVLKKGLAERLAAGSGGKPSLAALLGGSDAEFCERIGASANEFTGHINMYEETLRDAWAAESAAELKAEMQKLGIWEGEP